MPSRPPMPRLLPHLFALLLIALLGCAASAGQAETGDDTDAIVVLSYNIHHGAGLDGELDLERIADVIRRTEADVVALQEVDNETQRTGRVDQAAELADMLDMHHAFGRAIDYQGGEYGNAILSRFPIENARTHPLPQTEPGEDRVALIARIKLDTGRRFTLIDTHLDHASQPNRKVQVQALNDLLDAIDADAPTLLAGDINATPDTPELQQLTDRWTRACAADPSPTSPADEPARRIDYIFTHPADRWEAIDATVIDEPLASDHRPVRAVLRLE